MLGLELHRTLGGMLERDMGRPSMAAGAHIAPILSRSARSNADQQQISRAPSLAELTVVTRFRDGPSPEPAPEHEAHQYREKDAGGDDGADDREIDDLKHVFGRRLTGPAWLAPLPSGRAASSA